MERERNQRFLDEGMSEVPRETQLSIAASSMFPGFRFSPTDEELISHYLKKKIQGSEKSVEVIAEVEICKYEPWDLPAKSIIESENEWFFFSPRGRKYPNGSQSKRATEYGYWKATGKERIVKSGSTLIGSKRTLVFHIGRAPKGERTEWIMHEYCMEGKSQDSLVVCRLRKNTEFRMNGSQRRLSTMTGHNHAISEVNIDQTNLSEREQGIESSSNKCSSSYDSYSIGQVDSTSESDQKPSNEFTQPESSHQQDCDRADDCFAEIMNDDIIKLDETFLADNPQLLFMIADKTELERESEPPEPVDTTQVLPFQGTANRRIRLKKQSPRRISYPAEYMSIEPPKYLMKSMVNRLIYLLVIILTLLVLFSSLGGSGWVKKVIHTTMYHDF